MRCVLPSVTSFWGFGHVSVCNCICTDNGKVFDGFAVDRSDAASRVTVKAFNDTVGAVTDMVASDCTL